MPGPLTRDPTRAIPFIRAPRDVMNLRFTDEGMKSSPFVMSPSKGPISHAASVISQQRRVSAREPGVERAASLFTHA